MFNFPYFSYPYHNPYYRYYNVPKNYVNIQKKESNDNTFEQIPEKESKTKNVQRALPSLDNNTEKDSPIFEIFGIKLYSDDLIILAVLFLLYEQNVKDEMLYIILFLLLFS